MMSSATGAPPASSAAAAAGGPGSLARRTPFGQVAAALERLNQLRGAQKRLAAEHLIAEWLREDEDAYPLMRLLLPHLDMERTTYGMKETVLAKSIIQALNLARDSPDAQTLMHWRRPTVARDAGDFGAVVFTALRNRCPPRGRLTVEQVNEQLNALNAATDRVDKEAVVRTFLSQCSALENKWVIRIILRDLKIGMSENTLLGAFHPDALDLYHVCSDLRRVCRELKSRDVRLAEHEIKLFAPFKPMFAQRVPFHEISAKLQDDYYIEPKLDGERIQLHKRGAEYKYWSRKGKDYTYLYGASPTEGSLTPFIHASFGPKVTEVILDGEMVAFDPNTKTFVPFSTLKSAALGTDGDNHPCFVVFDIVFLNGECIITQPLDVRRQFLEKAITPREGYLHLVDSYRGRSQEDLIHALDIAIERRQEGLVVKHVGSTYMPSKRIAEAWIKVKPEYIDNLGDDLDLLIVGGYYSDGRRRGGKVTHFMCALADEQSATPDSDNKPTRFLTFCKFGSGMTDDMCNMFAERLGQHWRAMNKERPPEWLHFTDEVPELWIPPSKSLIVTVKASEITPTKKYGVGFTLRFPRLVRIRDDKDWHDCMTIAEMHTLRHYADGRLSSKRIGEAADSPRKRRKLATRSKTVRTVVSLYQGANVTNVERLSNLFDGLEFCVMQADDAAGGKQSVEIVLAQHGARLVQNPMRESTHCVVADQVKLKVSNIIKSGHFDVAKSSYIADCVRHKAVLPKAPKHLLFATEATKRALAEAVDAFGDSFAETIAPADLSALLLADGSAAAAFPSATAKRARVRRLELLARIAGSGPLPPLGPFAQTVVHLLVGEGARAAMAVPLLHFEALDGQLVDPFDETVTHIIADEHDASMARALQLREAFDALDWSRIHIVRKAWLTASLQDGAPKAPDVFSLSFDQV